MATIGTGESDDGNDALQNDRSNIFKHGRRRLRSAGRAMDNGEPEQNDRFNAAILTRPLPPSLPSLSLSIFFLSSLPPFPHPTLSLSVWFSLNVYLRKGF
jgi:hypothetical protein